jgi:prepilin-type N-terminal cleavage/methylation domain-containing protein
MINILLIALAYNEIMNKMTKNGFSLVELSVVLVIIGLIVGGITGGANLLHTAKLNKVISELKGYETGVENFRLKYNAWPGDMPNATSIWGTYNAGTNPTGVTDGNGNEKLDPWPEVYQTWSHLAKSGLIVGDYNGVGTGYGNASPGTNLPESGAVKSTFYFISDTGTGTPHFGVSGNFLNLLDSFGGGGQWDGKMKPSDVYYIDKKMDDGDNGISSATTGKILALRNDSLGGDNTKCVTAHWSAPRAYYILTDDTESCRLLLWLEKK